MELQEDQTNDQPGDSNVYDFGGADFLGDHGSLGEDAKVMLLSLTFSVLCLMPLLTLAGPGRLLEMQGQIFFNQSES